MKNPIQARDVLAFLAGMWSMAIFGILGLALLLSLTGCASSRPAPAPAELPALSTQLRRDSAASLPPYLVPAPAGSTPRQRRQWQRAQTRNLARAGILPAKVKNSSVATAPGATSINRPAAPVATGSGAATDARKAGQRGGAAAVGPGAVATATRAGASWWWYVLAAVAGAVGWEVLTSQVTPLRLLLKWRKVS